jgi:hypothetical protein
MAVERIATIPVDGGRIANALALVNAIPGAWLARFNGGAHAFMAQYPRPLANLINEFLALG